MKYGRSGEPSLLERSSQKQSRIVSIAIEYTKMEEVTHAMSRVSAVGSVADVISTRSSTCQDAGVQLLLAGAQALLIQRALACWASQLDWQESHVRGQTWEM